MSIDTRAQSVGKMTTMTRLMLTVGSLCLIGFVLFGPGVGAQENATKRPTIEVYKSPT